MFQIGVQRILTVCGLSVVIILQGCLGASAPSRTAAEALALSASALSGSEQYALTGEVSVVDPSGSIANQLTYEGKVSGHGSLEMKWKATNKQGLISQSDQVSSYKPLQLLEAIRADSAAVSYVQSPASATVVELLIKLDDDVARERIVQDIRQELDAVGEQNKHILSKSKAAEQLLANAKQTMEDKLATLKVTTECKWTANERTWFPSQITEETVLRYQSQGKAYEEQRLSVTYFLTAD